MHALASFTGDPGAPARDPITLDVTLRITVSPDDWDLVYGTGTLPEAVRDDVVNCVHSAAQHVIISSERAASVVELAPAPSAARLAEAWWSDQGHDRPWSDVPPFVQAGYTIAAAGWLRGAGWTPDGHDAADAAPGYRLDVDRLAALLEETDTAAWRSRSIDDMARYIAAALAPDGFDSTALELFRRIKEEVERSDGSWPGADTVELLCTWFASKGLDPEGPVPA